MHSEGWEGEIKSYKSTKTIFQALYMTIAENNLPISVLVGPIPLWTLK